MGSDFGVGVKGFGVEVRVVIGVWVKGSVRVVVLVLWLLVLFVLVPLLLLLLVSWAKISTLRSSKYLTTTVCGRVFVCFLEISVDEMDQIPLIPFSAP